MKGACLRMLVASCAVLAAASSSQAGKWEVIPPLWPDSQTEAVALAANGSVIVGSSGTPTGQQAFRWTLETGTVGIDKPSGLPWTWATDVSADGSYVAGYGGGSFGTRAGWEGFRWNTSGALDRIPVTDQGVWAKGISADGSVVVGTAQAVSPANSQSWAFRWTLTGGVEALTSDPNIVSSNATAISADGQTIVGDMLNSDVPPVRNAFQWTASGGMTGLGGFSANAVSRDGSVVVGTATNPGFEACRWTQSGGLQMLGPYDDGSIDVYTSQALGVSGDGSTIVGFVENQSTDLRQAFIWKDDGYGIRLLQDVLMARYGFTELNGWSLTKAYAVSDDGITIVGRGYSPEGHDQAWRAIMAPEPGTGLLLAVASLCGLACACRAARRRGRQPLE